MILTAYVFGILTGLYAWWTFSTEMELKRRYEGKHPTPMSLDRAIRVHGG